MDPVRLPRFDHLRRLTDSQGLLRSARGSCPDRFGGYDTIDNAEALRLCAIGSQTVEAEVVELLAKTYYGFLSRGRRYDSGVHHYYEAGIGWNDRGDDALVQSFVARALAAVIVSDLPITIRLSAADWWRMLLEECADRAHGPLARANWLIALGALRAADPGRDVERAERLADSLLTDFYYPNRASGWEWYEPHWSPLGALVPTAMWHGHRLLGERRLARVAQAMTQFLIENLFAGQLLVPIGFPGGWSRRSVRVAYDQAPAEVRTIVELLCVAEWVSGNRAFGDRAEQAANWFAGNNTRGAAMIDPASGGCYDLLTAQGPTENQGAAAILSCLLAQAALAARPASIPEPETDLFIYPIVEPRGDADSIRAHAGPTSRAAG